MKQSLIMLRLLALAFTCPLLAQAIPATPGPFGSVTGHVICSDTQRPARFASVFLMPRPKPVAKTVEQTKADGTTISEPESLLMVQATTSLDGMYFVDHLPPGDYYVIAHMAGYILPLAVRADDAITSPTFHPADANIVLRNFPVAHVVADHTVTVNASMDRGGTISGHVEFEDGTPFVGQWVQVELAEGADPFRQSLQLPVMSDILYQERIMATDERGRYHFSGLPPGKYRVYTEIFPEQDLRTVGTSERWGGGSSYIKQMFSVYYPDAFRRSGAKVIEVKRAEEASDENIRVNLGGLHTVRGKLLSAVDQHALSAGFLALKDPKDDKDISRLTQLKEDGSYHFAYVPSGTYELSVGRSGDVAPNDVRGYELAQSYVETKIPVIVGDEDVNLDDILLQPMKKDDKKP